MTDLVYPASTRLVFWLSIGLWLLPTVGSHAQNHAPLDQEVYIIVERPPEFPGGFPAIRDYLIKNEQYPPAARAAKTRGRVLVSFIVNQDGKVSTVTVVDGLGNGCDEEAVRLVSEMPRWIPGSQSGQPLRVKVILPVLFGMDYPPTYPKLSRH
ncbi:energy transducer TonB [Spirosoma rigui]|uniref:energy transducer TonB n=1 Tax=Spirosoma rigui TaxID=564064 RepID=UPI0009B18A34|nr:energy transducer TonB [Spirosoma rigui]